VRNARVWRAVLGVDEAVVERVEFDEDSRAVVGHVRLVRATRGRCGICRCRCSGYDAGEGRRRWRTLDLGSRPAYIEADAPRVSCPKHGVVVAHVPWARHGAGHTDPRLHRAYLLKEGLRYVFAVKSEAGKQALDRWLSWARRCRIPAFVHLAKRISAVRPHIDAALEHGLSNALIESVNTKIRLITRVAFGFRSATALIALVMLSLGGHRPALPGRIDPRIGQ